MVGQMNAFDALILRGRVRDHGLKTRVVISQSPYLARATPTVANDVGKVILSGLNFLKRAWRRFPAN